MAGQHDLASDLLDTVFTKAMAMSGAGASENQFDLSISARRALAGDPTMFPSPTHLVALFSQVMAFAAGKRDNPQFGARQGSNPIGALPHPTAVPLSQDVVDVLMTAVMDAAPTATPRATIQQVVNTVSHQPGPDLSTKLMGYRKGLGGPLHSTKQMVARESDDGSGGLTVHQTDSKARFHVAAQQECVTESQDTKGNCSWLNMNATVLQKCFQSLAIRAFASTHFSLVMLVPDIGGRPSVKNLTLHFGEAEDGRLSGSQTAAWTSESEDGTFYPWLGMALSVLHAIEAPSLDPKFSQSIGFFVDGVTRWRSVGLPMRMVTRQLCKVFMHAEHLHNRSSAHVGLMGFNTSACMYSDTQEIRDGKAELDSWNRASIQQDMVRLQRASAMAGGFSGNAGLTKQQVLDMISHASKQSSGDKRKHPHEKTGKSDRPPAKKPAKNKDKPGKGRPARGSSQVDSIDLKKWLTNFGGAPEGGGSAPCFFHWNRKAGCKTTGGRTCSKSHTVGPSEYGGKVFADLTDARQKAILTRCSK